MRRTLNGYEVEIPDGETTRSILRPMTRLRPRTTTGTGGQQEATTNPEANLHSRLGVLSRHARGSTRDSDRIRAEIKLLESAYGPHNVEWAADYSFVVIHSFKLPVGYDRTETRILILFPEGYHRGTKIGEFFVQAGLRHRDGKLPRFFCDDSYTDRGDNLVSQLRDEGWACVRLHQDPRMTDNRVVTYLDQMYTWLSSPLGE